MRCPYCATEDSRVIDSRSSDDGKSIRRRRECRSCEKRFTSYERIDEGPAFVVKRDGRREEFQREKILDGLCRACQKLPIPEDTLNKIADRVIFQVGEKYGREVRTADVGDCVLKELRGLDPVAYVRFASVYKQFRDIEEFFDLLRDLMEEKSTRRLTLKKQ